MAISTKDHDRTLIDRARAGDSHALEELVEPLFERFCRAGIRSFRLSRQDAEDCAQEALGRICTSYQRYDPAHGASPSTWFFTIHCNICRDALRKSRRRREDLFEDVQTARGLEVISEEAIDTRLDLISCLQLLKAEERDAVVLRRIYDFSRDEIVGMLYPQYGWDAYQKRVKDLLRDAERDLRAHLEASGHRFAAKDHEFVLNTDQQALASCLELTDEQREAIILKREGHTRTQIAKKLFSEWGLTAYTSRIPPLINRAEKKLLNHLRDAGGYERRRTR